MAEKKTDEYVNILALDVEQSAANTLTFEEIQIGLNIFDKVGIVVNRLEFLINTTMVNEMTVAADKILAALCTSNNITGLSIKNTEVVDMMQIHRFDLGAAATGTLVDQPFIRDFSSFPGGGILIPPKPLYFAVDSSGLANAGTVTCKISFVLKTLASDQYLELIETRRAFG